MVTDYTLCNNFAANKGTGVVGWSKIIEQQSARSFFRRRKWDQSPEDCRKVSTEDCWKASTEDSRKASTETWSSSSQDVKAIQKLNIWSKVPRRKSAFIQSPTTTHPSSFSAASSRIFAIIRTSLSNKNLFYENNWNNIWCGFSHPQKRMPWRNQAQRWLLNWRSCCCHGKQQLLPGRIINKTTEEIISW